MTKRTLKKNAFRLLAILLLLTVLVDFPPSHWVAVRLDPVYGLEEYELDLNDETLVMVSFRKSSGHGRLALSFISVDNKFPCYYWCYFVDLKIKYSTPNAYNMFVELMEDGIFHEREGLPFSVQGLIREALTVNQREKQKGKSRII